jgi:hypothetical protein
MCPIRLTDLDAAERLLDGWRTLGAAERMQDSGAPLTASDASAPAGGGGSDSLRRRQQGRAPAAGITLEHGSTTEWFLIGGTNPDASSAMCPVCSVWIVLGLGLVDRSPVTMQ